MITNFFYFPFCLTCSQIWLSPLVHDHQPTYLPHNFFSKRHLWKLHTNGSTNFCNERSKHDGPRIMRAGKEMLKLKLTCEMIMVLKREDWRTQQLATLHQTGGLPGGNLPVRIFLSISFISTGRRLVIRPSRLWVAPIKPPRNHHP
jgi:hypothetical protein